MYLQLCAIDNLDAHMLCAWHECACSNEYSSSIGNVVLQQHLQEERDDLAQALSEDAHRAGGGYLLELGHHFQRYSPAVVFAFHVCSKEQPVPENTARKGTRETH